MSGSDQTPPLNRQAGAPVGDGQTDSNHAVAHGDRREDVRYETDDAQLVRVRHTFKPDQPRPPEEQSQAQQEGRTGEPPVVEDVAEVKPSPSVWDARPTDR